MNSLIYWFRTRLHLLAICSLALVWTPGCAYPDPYMNFKNLMDTMVGEKFEFDEYSSWKNPERLVNTTTMPNGHVAYTFSRPNRTCQYTLVVNPETRIIVSTHWKGGDCALNP